MTTKTITNTASITPIKLQLSEWGLPPLIVSWFRKKGITSLFEWQVDCLCRDNVLFGDNLVYSAPTSAGKTLVADFLLIKRVLEYGKKALVIEPFVALTREKAATLKSMLNTTNARVGAFGGTYYTPGGMASVKVAVCTIEKANNFINKLINEEKLGELGIIVVDEIHYLGDESRGYQLELLLTKVLYHNSQQNKNNRIQIVGLSATIPNLESIANWLHASLFVTDYRPVPLIEKIKIENKIYDVNAYIKDPSCEPLETIIPGRFILEKDFDDLCYICIDSIVSGHSSLIFCESKRECEIMAGHLAAQIRFAGTKLDSDNPVEAETSQKLRENLCATKILATADKLKKCPAGLDKELIKSVQFGVAFHHAGLTSEEREIIEDGFKVGAIKALMATSTLSSGVNLPARRVIIRSPTMVYTNGGSYQKEMLHPTTYRQMIGRAGRKNIDTCGESILICRPDNQQIAIELIKASLGNITSSLANRMIAAEGEPSGLKKAVLEVIANNTAKTRVHLNQYLQSTFWLATTNREEVAEFNQAIAETLRYLVTKKFIEELKPGVFRSTRLGTAVLTSGLHPDSALELLQDLTKARQGFCLLNDLHIIYQVTPSDIARTIELKDWQHYSKIWHELDETCQYVGERVGIDEITIGRRCQGFISAINPEKERIYKRFWVALVINDLISEMPLSKICDKYRIAKALVQQAQRAVAQFAGVISIFCNQLGYDNIAALVTPLESRVNFSCQRDLLDLIKLNITRPIARALFNQRYKNPIAVAKADKLDIDFIIRQIKPFKKDSSFSMDKDSCPTMWVPELAKNMSTLDYASHIVNTARSFVEIEYELDVGHKDDLMVRANKDDLKVRANKDEITVSRANNDDFAVSRVDNDDQTISAKNDALTNRGDNYDLTISAKNDDLTNRANNDDLMVRANKDVPNFVVKYVGTDTRDLNKFLDKWVIHSNVSLNFKLCQRVNQPIGERIKRVPNRPVLTTKRIRTRSRSRAKSDASEEDEASNSQEEEEEVSASQQGLPLRLEIDNQKHIVTRLYACFDNDLTVYIIDNQKSFIHIRDNIANFLNESYASATAATSTQRLNDFVRIKLFTQNITLTYKVLYCAFNLDESILNRHFEWHSFDVAWWLVNNCPNRGLNNRNSSLSLVAKTDWARNYRHFLHQSSAKTRHLGGPSTAIAQSSIVDQREFSRLRDIVKAGKTAILKPLIEEIVVELIRRNQTKAYYEAEMLSRLTMAQMMVHGIGLDVKSMRAELELYEDLQQQLTYITQKYYAKTLNTVALTNIRHVAHILYTDLNLKQHLEEHRTITDISKDPTCAEVLTILAAHHPFPKLVQDFRKISKAHEALQAVSTHARYNSELDMYRVFGQCDFWQLTGRIAMSDPDLFLINRNFTVSIPAHGNRPGELVNCVPRRCFVPVADWVFLAADYSQLELRLLAHFSEDENLLEILNRRLDSDETFDVFKTVASKIHQKPVEEVTGEMRQQAKQICYGIIYGMGNTTLANRLSVDIERAEEFRQEFFTAFPRISSYTKELIEECEQVGYVESLLGRRRALDGISSEHSSVRAKCERVAINTRIQSSASDLIKLAMELAEKKLLEQFSGKARLVLEMHDELIYEVSPFVLTRFASALKFTMENLALTEGLKVKLLVSLKKGTDWSNLQDFNL